MIGLSSRWTKAVWAVPFVLVACVTVNVYFPAPAVDAAAEKVVREVWGDMAPAGASPPGEGRTGAPHSRMTMGRVVTALLDWVSTPAHAGADINVSTAAIRQLLNSLHARATDSLKEHLYSGAIGVNASGDLEVRSEQGLSVRDRARVRGLVQADNSDRAALYREIARANGHPEWADEIRSRFAAKWIAEARPGWWVQQGGGWRQK